MLRRTAALAALLLLSLPAAAGTLNFANWNLLNYPGTTGAARAPYFRTALAEAAPDLLVCQEVLSASGAQHFFDNVLEIWEPGLWEMAPFHDSYDTDRALYIREIVHRHIVIVSLAGGEVVSLPAIQLGAADPFPIDVNPALPRSLPADADQRPRVRPLEGKIAELVDRLHVLQRLPRPVALSIGLALEEPEQYPAPVAPPQQIAEMSPVVEIARPDHGNNFLLPVPVLRPPG